MRGVEPPSVALNGSALEARVREVFDTRLTRGSPRPFAVALSGGGDSLALTLLADAWAHEAGRPLIVLTVDHRLQAQSRDWTAACAAVAARLGRPFRALVWKGAKPASGLPAAARQARHRLLAEAAREAGARVILMGHTADDVLEARLMREAGATTPEPQSWAPSPVWPEGRGLFLLRPLLEARRRELRAWLEARRERWIEDPANADPRYARSRARKRADPQAPVEAAARGPLGLAEGVTEAAGVLYLHRPALRSAAADEVGRLLGLACVCAAGGERRPATVRIARAAEGLRGQARFVATLAGARIEADDETVRIAREPGEAGRGGLQALELPVGREVVWDGRFAVTARRCGLQMRAAAGVAARLPAQERRRLNALPRIGRGGLPVVVGPDGAVSSPVVGGPADVEVRSLVGDRLRAAAGLVPREEP